jgi:threonine dehydratase
MNSSPASPITAEAAPGYADIEAAAKRLAGQAVLTPLLRSPALDAELGARVLIKPETLQRTGSFKFRGAYNKIRRLMDGASPPRAVAAFSSGNHAQGVAAAAQLLGVKATIVMPADAPAIKIANTKGYGAEVVLYDRYREDREAVAARVAAERGAALVKPYDDPDIIAGQGTVGKEIAEQAKAMGLEADIALAPCSGGGLVCGTALGLTRHFPKIRIFACEPEAFDDTARSLVRHERQSNAPGGTSICDALMSPMPGAITFPINDRLLAGGLAVSDAEVAAAVAYAFRVLKLVVEPGGAVGLAALLARKIAVGGQTVALVLSGGNVDPEPFAKLIAPPQ